MSKKKEKIKQSDLQGFKYLKKLSQMLERLHNAGCKRDKAGNRILHMDQYMTLLLLCMFSPISKSLRSMQIIDAESNFACRINDDSVFETIEERQLDSDSLQAGIRRDMIVRLGCASVKDDLKQPVRIIRLKTTEQTQHSALRLPYQGRKPPETMLICTDRLDLPADVIALIYKCRWQIEDILQVLQAYFRLPSSVKLLR